MATAECAPAPAKCNMIGQNVRFLRLGLVPLGLCFFVFFVCPILNFLSASVIVNTGAMTSFTFKRYADALLSETVQQSLRTTLSLSLLTGVVSLTLGYLLAYHIVRRGPFVSKLIFIAAIASLFTSTIARAL